MSVTFASVADAMAARVRPVRLYVRIAGQAVPAWEAHVRHSVDSPVGSATVYCAVASLPPGELINAELEIEMGYPGATRRRFLGVIPQHGVTTGSSGHAARIDGVHRISRLAYRTRGTTELEGPISLKDAFRSLCDSRDATPYLSDDTTYIDGETPIMLGGNELITGGHVRFDNRESPLDWGTRNGSHFGYRWFGAPDGSTRQARVSGLPPESEAISFAYAEGDNCYRIETSVDRDKMITSWEVIGARYTDADGGVTQIRSIAESIPYDARLDPPGYREDTYSTQDLVTDEMAQGCRNCLEVDRADVWQTVAWDCAGHPDLQPGDIVTVHAPSHGIATPTRHWLLSIDESVTDRGYLARMEGFRGTGQALAAGNDCVTQAVTIPGDGVLHMGDESVAWFRDPSPDGLEYTIAITIPDGDYSSIRLTGMAHGTNTWGTGNVGNPTTGSAIELWQLKDPSLPESGTNEKKRVSTLDLPTLDEEYALHRNYAASDRYWSAFSLPVSGSLKAGAAELKVLAGDNPSGHDDYEIKDLSLTICGIGLPELPGVTT